MSFDDLTKFLFVFEGGPAITTDSAFYGFHFFFRDVFRKGWFYRAFCIARLGEVDDRTVVQVEVEVELARDVRVEDKVVFVAADLDVKFGCLELI